ncbi:hypothetical protein Aperf_G00000052568 [Anoplocephala perfoliata]
MIKDILRVFKLFSKLRPGRQLLSKAVYYQAKPALKRLLLSTSRYGPRYASLVQRMGKMFFTPSTLTRPNSLIRAFNSVSTLVRFRYELPLNDISFNKICSPLKPYNELRRSFVKGLRFESFKPGRYLCKGACGAVWAAEASSDNDTFDQAAEGKSKEVALKLLYNYYTCSTDEEGRPLSTSPDQWVLLNEQRHREVNLRPPGDHPNIVPILGDFFDRVPSSKGGTTLERIEDFPEGLGGGPHTHYLIMPRFDGSLEDLLKGKWKSVGALSPSTDSASSPTRRVIGTEDKPENALGGSVPSNPTFSLPSEEAVGVAVQMVEAIAQLERYHIVHRDIKASNFLVKSRSLPRWSDRLNAEEAKLANTRLQVALTDFGCAIQVDTTPINRNLLSHSGNTALWAPEVAEYFSTQNQLSNDSSNTAAVYARSDLWAVATIVYQLFGQVNPFLSGKLTSKDYTESQLPLLQSKAPSVLGWLLGSCLRRDPSFRPPARLAADVLHTWCLLQLLKRLMPNQFKEVVPRVPLPAGLLVNKLFVKSVDPAQSAKEDWISIEMEAAAFSRRLRQRRGVHQTDPLREALRKLLELLWAADWILGPAKANLGIRVNFYQRITLERFAFCLAIVQLAENRHLINSV